MSEIRPVGLESPVLKRTSPPQPEKGLAPYQLLEPYGTGQQCVCSDCPGTFQGWWIVSRSGVRNVKVTRREHPERQCSHCDCRFNGHDFIPCARFQADPRSGIRYQPEQPGSAGVTRLEWYAMERLEKLFPGIGANEMFLVAQEINLFLDLQALFPEESVSRLITRRQSSVFPALCPACRQPVAMSVSLHATYGRPEKQPAETALPVVELNQTSRPEQVNQPDHLSLF